MRFAWKPRKVFARMGDANSETARQAAGAFARDVGAPVGCVAIAGTFRCPTPELLAVTYSGAFQGGALIPDATGNTLAYRPGSEGSGIVVADIDARRTAPADDTPNRYWLHRRGLLAAYSWHTQRLHGRRWYARHVRGRAALDLQWRPAAVPTAEGSIQPSSAP